MTPAQGRAILPKSNNRRRDIMPYKLADDTLSTDYKVGDLFKFSVTDRGKLCGRWDYRDLRGVVELIGEDGTACPYFKSEFGNKSYEMWCYLKPAVVKQQPELYTESELSEIDELRDEVDRLNDLCVEYAKIIAEKDATIEAMKFLSR